jgi:gamma-D-glutamyl-L-lysine dipeptidyl-peptidase
MLFAICPLSVVPMRKEPSDRAEMVSQLLFGEQAEVLEAREKWSRIACAHDGYQGWVDNKQVLFAHRQDGAAKWRCVSTHCMLARNAEHNVPLPFGALVPAQQQKLVTGSLRPAQESGTLEELFQYARAWMNAPYLWGGRTPMGVDCSGLTQALFATVGIALPRDAYQQAEIGIATAGVQHARAGDLAFFKDPNGRIVHVGIVFPNGRILHASGHVRMDLLDEQGILVSATDKYTHQLAQVRSIWPNDGKPRA